MIFSLNGTAMKLVKAPMKMRNCIKRSRVYITTYPETTLAEGYNSGIPTILYYCSNIFERHPEFDFLIELMKKNKLVFENANLLSKHLEDIWDEPLLWWDNDEVKKIRNLVNDYCLSQNHNWLKKWNNFFRMQL